MESRSHWTGRGKRIISWRHAAVFGVAACILAAPRSFAGEAGSFIERANAVRFEKGQQPPFIGIFTHTDATYGLADYARYIEHVNANNPYINGYAFRMQWRMLHPEKDRVDWEGLEKAIAAAASADRVVNIGVMAGGASPDWIYDEGVLKVGPFVNGSRIITTPLPWDPKFIELYQADLEEMARRYGNDPRVMSMEVVGPTYNYLGEEFHAPPAREVARFGWTRELALNNWKFWIDRYNEIFPNKKLYAVPSQMYRGIPGLSMSEEVTKYLAETCQGRAYFQTHQLSGKFDSLSEGSQLIQMVLDKAPATHELARTLKFAPEEQGTPAMSIYQILKTGSPFYIQLWSRDAEEPEYAKAVLDAWNKYGSMSVEECKAKLIEEGLYVEQAVAEGPNVPRGYKVTPYDLSRLPPEGYPGHNSPFIMDWSPFE